MITDALKQLNFTDNQAKIYLSLFDLGETRAGALIKSTGLHRHIVYTVLDELIERKLVTKVIKNKVHYYQAIDPTPLLLEIQQQQELATQVVKELQNKHQRTSQEIIVYEGLRDVQRFEIEHLKRLPKNSIINILGVVGDLWYQAMGPKNVSKYDELCVSQDITQRWIGYQYNQAEAEHFKKYPKHIKYKVVPGPKLAKSNLEIGPGYVALKSFGANPTVVEIKNNELSKAYQNYFDLLWQEEIKVYKGFEGIQEHRDLSLKELKKGDEIMVVGVSKASNDPIKSYWENYHHKRAALGIKARQIWDLKYKEEGERRSKIDLTEVKFQKQNVENPAFIEIWKDHVGIGIMKKDPFVISIDDAQAAKTFRNYFESLWQQENFVIQGQEKVLNYLQDCFKKMKSGQEFLSITERLSLLSNKKIDRSMWTELNKLRLQNKIKMRFFYHPEDKADYLKTMHDAGDENLQYTQLKPSPQLISAPMSIEIFPHVVTIIQWQQGEPTLFALEGKQIAKNYQKYFDGLWNLIK